MNILTTLSSLQKLTNNEKVLVDFILSNPNVIIHDWLNEIAAKSFVSVATIYRLINKLGLSGLRELKIELISSIKSIRDDTNIDYDYPILESDAPFQIIRNLNNIYTRTMDETIDYFDPQLLTEVGERLYQVKQIDVYTSSANLFSFKTLNFKLKKLVS